MKGLIMRLFCWRIKHWVIILKNTEYDLLPANFHIEIRVVHNLLPCLKFLLLFRINFPSRIFNRFNLLSGIHVNFKHFKESNGIQTLEPFIEHLKYIFFANEHQIKAPSDIHWHHNYIVKLWMRSLRKLSIERMRFCFLKLFELEETSEAVSW